MNVKGKTYKEVTEKQKKEILEQNMKTFNNVRIGVHGKELPKFTDNSKVQEYWKFRTNVTFTKRDKNNTTRINNSFLSTPRSIREIEKTYVAIKKKNDIPNKINDVKNYDLLQSIDRGKTKIRPRWTSTIIQICNNTPVLKEEILDSTLKPNKLDTSTKLKM